MGRLPTFNDGHRERILEMLYQGMTLTSACRSADDLPAPSTVCMWARKDEEFAKQYARAREVGYALMADQLADIADDGTNDYMTVVVSGHEIEKLDSEHIQRSKLRVDTRKWLLSKALPKIYGDKHQMEVSAPGGGPVEIAVTRRIIDANA